MSVFQPFAFQQGPASGGGGLPNIYTNNLVAWWDFGDPNSYSGTGTVVTDLSGNGNDGTIVGAATYVTTNGGGLQLNNVAAFNPYPHQHVNNRTDFFNSTTTWSVCMIGNYIPIQQSFGRIMGDIMQGDSGDMATYSNTELQINETGGAQGYWTGALGGNSFNSGATEMLTTSFSSSPAPWEIQVFRQNVRKYLNNQTGGTQIYANKGLRWGTSANQREGVAGVNYVLMAYAEAIGQTEVQQNFDAYKSRYGW